MSKFLDLVIESTPSEGKGPFTVEYKDVDGNLMATAIIPDDVGSSYENFINFVETSGGKLNVEGNVDEQGDAPVEDNEKKIQALTALLNVNVPKLTIPGSVASTVKKTQKMALKNLQRDLKSNR